jgi:diguanylate cyclase (GGDEF)-like protein
MKDTRDLEKLFSTNRQEDSMSMVPKKLHPVLKRIVVETRLEVAREIEAKKEGTTNPDLLTALDQQLIAYDDFLRLPEIRDTETARVPLLREYLTLERVDAAIGSTTAFRQRVYDEKFHILMAPTLFLPDLDFYRKTCGMREVPILIAFMDIDKFKDFNTEIGETNVDRHVLPVFMEHLERHVYARGYAYRYGGDEYAILLPNTKLEHGLPFLAQFQDRLKGVSFRGTDRRITVSVGCCEVNTSTRQTDRELLQKAEQAKNFAKQQGRDRIGSYRSELLEDDGLYVFEHVQADEHP